MSQSLWQHPYVNVFKHCDVGVQWKKSSRHGDVTTVMDKSIKATVWRISGSIPANNFILCPRTGSQSLGLTGRYFYLLFKPIVGKYFSVHLDIAADEQLVIRVSFSNLFKEFKATSTWLQFPFSSASPQCQWTFLVIDLHYTLNMYVKRQYLYVKSVKLCSNMLVKNVFTSDILFDPTLTQSARHRLLYEKLLEKGMMPISREMAFPVPKGGDWTELYDLVTFPDSGEAHKMIARNVGVTEFREMMARQEGKKMALMGSSGQCEQLMETTGRHEEMGDRGVKVRGPVSHSVRQGQGYKLNSNADRLRTKPDERVESKDSGEVVSSDNREVHVYSEHPDDVAVHYEDSDESEGTESDIESVDARVSEVTRKKRPFRTLQPDPILQLSHVVGFGGKTYSHVLWTYDGGSIVYPCHNLIVSMNVSSRKQVFFIGHTDKVCSIAFNGSTSLLASCQCSSLPVIRLWQFSSRQCLTVLNVSISLIHSLSLSHSGRVLAAGGRDRHGKQAVLVWSISSVKDQTLTTHNKRKNRVPETQLIARAHTDVNMTRLRISGFDDTRMVSCGYNNVRLWRVKQRSLRSCPVNTGEYHHVHFTDAVFDETVRPDGRDERRVFASTACGKVFVINYTQIQVMRVVQLESGQINCLAVSELFCATGSMSSLKLWKIDFSSVFLETEQDGNVMAVGVSQDGLKVLLASDQGCIGMLDATSRSHSTLMRSHTDSIFSVSLHSRKHHMTTVSADNTIRVWDSKQHFTQLFDFCAPHDAPCCVAYHPIRNCLACGFSSGAVRIFHVSSTRLLAEHRHHNDYITGLAFTSDGSYLLSSGVDSLLVLYDSSQQSCPIIRALANTVARLKELSSCAIALNRRGTRAAFVGPSEFAVTVVDAHTLNEVLRLDISSALCGLESDRVSLDIATKVCYSSEVVGQLLVATRSCRLLRFDAEMGQVISEVCNVHRSKVSGVTVSTDGRLLVTSGDKLIKVWDYQMKLDLNFQVFIGHSSDINQLLFTPRSKQLISVGDAIFIWDLLSHPPSQMKTPPHLTATQACSRAVDNVLSPRHKVPQPTAAPQVERHLPSPLDVTQAGADGETESGDDQAVEEHRHDGTETVNRSEGRGHESGSNETDVATSPQAGIQQESVQQEMASVEDKVHKNPFAFKHYTARETVATLSQRRYVAPPQQSGLSLYSVLGYNGRGRDNVVWHPQTGLFAFTSGCLIVMEDLSTATQKHLVGHNEEVSTLSLQHDGQVLASASGSKGLRTSQICIWDIHSLVCKKVLSYHESQIVCLSYSRDDRFLISVGDYSACSIAMWDTRDYSIVATAKPPCPIHSVKWDPYTVNEFLSVGANAAVLFWLVDETNDTISLSLCEGEVPQEIKQLAMEPECAEFTTVSYAGNEMVYVASTLGIISAWSTQDSQCVMHWPADDTEIDTLNCDKHRVVSGSCAGHLKLWSLPFPADTLQCSHTVRRQSITLESDITLDAAITSASFDEDMAVGVVGTARGTIWFINWATNSTVRLTNGHSQQVNGVAFPGLPFDSFASCCDDGGLHLWSLSQLEQRMQFLKPRQPCKCIAFPPFLPDQASLSGESATQLLPVCAAGYEDGSIRIFDFSSTKMKFKLHPHEQSVNTMAFSLDGSVLISGGADGLVAVTSPSTGITVRLITDHKHVPITCISVANTNESCVWLAASTDQRVSVWSADWLSDHGLSLIDWLTFPSPPFTPNGSNRQEKNRDFYKNLPPTIALFSPTDSDLIVYTGYGLHKQILFYCLSKQKVLRTVSLTHWVTCMDVSPQSHLVAVGCRERLVKLVDFTTGSFQDFIGHCDCVAVLKFSPDGSYLMSVGYNDVLIWNVQFQ